MNFFSDTKLAYRLKNNEVPEKEKFWYLLITLMTVELLYYITSEVGGYSWIEGALTIGVEFIVCYVCYVLNSKNDKGDRFIEKYICLGLPIGIQVLILEVGSYICLRVVGLRYESDLNSKLYDLLFALGVNLYVSYRYIRAFKIIASPEKDSKI